MSDSPLAGPSENMKGGETLEGEIALPLAKSTVQSVTTIVRPSKRTKINHDSDSENEEGEEDDDEEDDGKVAESEMYEGGLRSPVAQKLSSICAHDCTQQTVAAPWHNFYGSWQKITTPSSLFAYCMALPGADESCRYRVHIPHNTRPFPIEEGDQLRILNSSIAGDETTCYAYLSSKPIICNCHGDEGMVLEFYLHQSFGATTILMTGVEEDDREKHVLWVRKPVGGHLRRQR